VAKEIGLVVISIGKDDGVLEGDELTVYRSGEVVAKIAVDRADRKWSAGKVFQKKSDPLVADDVTNHLSFSAPRGEGHPNPPTQTVSPPSSPQPNSTLRIIERVQPTMHPLVNPARQEDTSPKDWMEIVKARLEVQRARIKEAQVALEQARANLARMEQIAKSGLAVESDLLRCRNEVETLSAQLAVKQAEYNEVEVMLVQARQKLNPLAPR
jgi:hypothetical protein